MNQNRKTWEFKIQNWANDGAEPDFYLAWGRPASKYEKDRLDVTRKDMENLIGVLQDFLKEKGE